MLSNLLSWQWQSYAVAHRDRRNLVLHLMTTPLFIAGTAAVLASPLIGGWPALPGLGAMLATLIVQGRGHRRETSAPVPFTGPGDLVTRFFAEQLVNFPRFALSGGWLRAWRAAGAVIRPQ
jgi:hypothetical protein